MLTDPITQDEIDLIGKAYRGEATPEELFEVAQNITPRLLVEADRLRRILRMKDSQFETHERIISYLENQRPAWVYK